MDFLQRLAAAALGQQGGLRPVLPGRYEGQDAAVGEAPAVVEPLAAAPRPTTADAEPEPVAVLRVGPPAAARAPGSAPLASCKTALTDGTRFDESRGVTAPLARDARSVLQAASPEHCLPPAPPSLDDAAPAGPPSHPQAAPAAPRPTPTAALQRAPQQPIAAWPVTAARHASTASTIVHVNIDRIDVRAAPSRTPAPPPAAPARQRSDPHALADYLRGAPPR